MTAQELISSRKRVVAYDITGWTIDASEPGCSTRIGTIEASTSHAEDGTLTLHSGHPRVSFAVGDLESRDVAVTLPAGGGVSIPVTVACGPAAPVDGAISLELTYPNGPGMSGRFTVAGTVR